MSRRCRECRKGRLNIIGMGGYNDTIIVECPHCGEEYEVEPDGLGEGGMEMVEAFEIENRRRDEEEEEDDDSETPAPNPIPKQQYGFCIPSGLRAMWSARAIYTVNPEPDIDLLPDRQWMHGDNESEEALSLVNWLNTVGIKGIKAQCQQLGLQPSESRIVEFRRDGWLLRGNPNSSYGYLYLVAHKVPADDATV